jgi:hypothetical protein
LNGFERLECLLAAAGFADDFEFGFAANGDAQAIAGEGVIFDQKNLMFQLEPLSYSGSSTQKTVCPASRA